MFDDFFDPGGFFDFDFDGHTSMTEGLTGLFIMNECLNDGGTPDDDDYIDSEYGSTEESVADNKTEQDTEEAESEDDYDPDEFDSEEEKPYIYRTPYPIYEEKDLSYSESRDYVEPVKNEDTSWKKDYSPRFRSLSHKLGERIENYSDEERFLGAFIPALCLKAPNALEIIDQYAKYMSVSMKEYSKECEYYKAVMRASRDDDFFGNVIRASMLDTSYLGFKQSMNLANRTIYKSVNYVEESEYLKSLAIFTKRYNVLTKVSKTDPSKIRRKAANKILAIQYEGIRLPSYGNPDEAVASCEAVLNDVLTKEVLYLILHHGSPDDMTGRSDREVRSYAFLDGLGIDFDRTDHPDRPATTMEVCADVDAVLGVHICKNLFLCNRQKTDFYLLIMPGDKPFKTKELSKQLGVSRLSFADEEFMTEFLDLHPGSVSVLGLMNDKDHRVTLVIDEDVLKEEMFGCHPCENTSSIRFRTSDLTDKILPALGTTPKIVHLVGAE